MQYYFDQKKEVWTYAVTKNNQRKQILTAELEQMDAVTIIQDLDSPTIRMQFPGNGGKYHFGDVDKISIKVEDEISGIESKETSFKLQLNDKTLYPAYHPLKKIISYNLDKPLEKGAHTIDFSVEDRMGNQSSETIYFSIY